MKPEKEFKTSGEKIMARKSLFKNLSIYYLVKLWVTLFYNSITKFSKLINSDPARLPPCRSEAKPCKRQQASSACHASTAESKKLVRKISPNNDEHPNVG